MVLSKGEERAASHSPRGLQEWQGLAGMCVCMSLCVCVCVCVCAPRLSGGKGLNLGLSCRCQWGGSRESGDVERELSI